MTDVTIKTNAACIQEHEKINKVLAVIDAKNLAKLLDTVGLTANPRKSKLNTVTTAICDTLRTSPRDFRFKSKGLLISTSKCIPHQRDRFTISFEDPNYEGVLDGGHNMLAIGIYILEVYFGEADRSIVKKIKNWDTFIEVWLEHKDDLDEVLDAFDFEVPIEIIYPSSSDSADFIESVLEISDARNNNSALTAGTKADFKGYYDILKSSVDRIIHENVEWKDGDSGKYIKRDDIVAMALIPFMALQEKGLLDKEIPNINPVTLYSSKGKCIELFNLIYRHYSDDDGDSVDPLIINALKVMEDLPRLYDLIYKKFPRAAKDNSLAFGRISTVKLYESGKSGDSYLSKAPLTKYYRDECSAKYPDGFIFPIFCSLYALMKVEDGKVDWAIKSPDAFLERSLSECTKMLVSSIKEMGYNPQTVGKSSGAYEGMRMSFQFYLAQHGK